MNINDKNVSEFIKRNFNYEDFPGDNLNQFKVLLANGKEIAAAEEYCKVTGANIEEALLAVAFTKSL